MNDCDLEGKQKRQNLEKNMNATNAAQTKAVTKLHNKQSERPGYSDLR